MVLGLIRWLYDMGGPRVIAILKSELGWYLTFPVLNLLVHGVGNSCKISEYSGLNVNRNRNHVQACTIRNEGSAWLS